MIQITQKPYLGRMRDQASPGPGDDLTVLRFLAIALRTTAAAAVTTTSPPTGGARSSGPRPVQDFPGLLLVGGLFLEERG
jgi:hypothetical protein